MEKTDLQFYLTWLKDQLKLSVSLMDHCMHMAQTKKLEQPCIINISMYNKIIIYFIFVSGY